MNDRWATVRFWRAIKFTLLVFDIVLVAAVYLKVRAADGIMLDDAGMHATVTASSGLKLRAAASLDGTIVGYVGNGVRIEVLDSLGPDETINGRTY